MFLTLTVVLEDDDDREILLLFDVVCPADEEEDIDILGDMDDEEDELGCCVIGREGGLEVWLWLLLILFW